MRRFFGYLAESFLRRSKSIACLALVIAGLFPSTILAQSLPIDPKLLQQIDRSGSTRDVTTLNPSPIDQGNTLALGASTVQTVQDRPSPSELEFQRRSGSAIRIVGRDALRQYGSNGSAPTGAADDHYRMGIGDELVVTLRGAKVASYRTRVDREGLVVLPDLTPIHAAGMSFLEFKSAIASVVHRTMLGTDAFVSLGGLRQITVSVFGEVEQPGTYTLSSTSTLANALSIASGVRATGSLREVTVIRGGRPFAVDLYPLLLAKGTGRGVALQDGDTIQVPIVGPLIAIAGDVQRPGIFELRRGQGTISATAALDMAGGGIRAGSRFGVRSISRDGFDRFTGFASPAGLMLKTSDILTVDRSANVPAGSFQIVGPVSATGFWPINQISTLRSLFAKPNFFLPNAYQLFAIVETTDPGSNARKLVAINPRNIAAGRENYTLRSEDRVIIIDRSTQRYLASADIVELLTGEKRQKASSAISLERTSTGTVSDAEAKREVTDTGAGFVTGRDPSQTQGDAAMASRNTALNPASAQHSDRSRPLDPVLPGQAGSANIRVDQCPGLRALARSMTQAATLRLKSLVLAANQGANVNVTESVTCPTLFTDYPDVLPFILENVVAMTGEVRFPGLYPITETTTGDDLVAYAGGTTREADITNVELSSVQFNTGSGQFESQIASTSVADVATRHFAPGDIFRFNALYFNRESGPVIIGGEVKRPGAYDIRRGERLSQLIARAGGLLETAYPAGAVLLRQSTRRSEQVSVEATYQETRRQMIDALTVHDQQQPNQAAITEAFNQLADMMRSYKAVGRLPIQADPAVLLATPTLDPILEAGDELVFPKKPISVSVFGEVLSPGAYPYKPGAKPADYLRDAGGTRDRAQKSKIYVLLPNGVSRPISSGKLRSEFGEQLPPGSSIIVPRKAVVVPFLSLLPNLVSIISGAALTAASIATISK